MSVDVAIDLCHAAMIVSLMIAAPVLAGVLIAGLTIGIVQAVSQLQSRSFSFVPKVVASSRPPLAANLSGHRDDRRRNRAA